MTARISEGVIRADEMYTLEELKKRLSLSDSAWRALRDAGLPHIPMGKRKYLIGRKVIEWFERGNAPVDDPRLCPSPA